MRLLLSVDICVKWVETGIVVFSEWEDEKDASDGSLYGAFISKSRLALGIGLFVSTSILHPIPTGVLTMLRQDVPG